MSALAQLGENVEKAWWEQFGLLQAGRAENVDLLHCPYFASPLVSMFPTVVTIHDVIPLVLKEYAWRKQTHAYNALVSAAAKRRLGHHRGFAVLEAGHRATLQIPPSGSTSSGTPWTTASSASRRLEAPGGTAALRIGERYLLYFGGFDCGRTCCASIRSYARLPADLRREYQLVIAGRLHHFGHPLYPDPRR